MTPEFKKWPKIPRLHRDITITEKIDGTNAAVVIDEDGDAVYAQSRKRFIDIESDNFGFAAWVDANADDLRRLGPGHHFGEWYGQGIQRGYGLDERRFALFNPDIEVVPDCCETVPVLSRGTANGLNSKVNRATDVLRYLGSAAVPGFTRPEGIVVYHHAARVNFKVLLEGDELPKGVAA